MEHSPSDEPTPEASPTAGIQLIEHLAQYAMYRGCNDYFGAQLVKKSRQSAIRTNVPEDAGHRFADLKSYEHWLSQSRRHINLLTGLEADLGGIICFAQEDMPRSDDPARPNYHFDIRLYDGYRGRHLAKPFIRASLADFWRSLWARQATQEFRGLWFDTRATNDVAVALHGLLGYREAERFVEDGETRLIMRASRGAVDAWRRGF